MKRTRGASPDADDIHLRRERGRKAQQAFRQRQITAINELRASNEAMQAAIAKVSQVASKLGSAELDRAVRDAVSIAGLERQASASLDAGKAPSPPPPGPSSEPQFPTSGIAHRFSHTSAAISPVAPIRPPGHASRRAPPRLRIRPHVARLRLRPLARARGVAAARPAHRHCAVPRHRQDELRERRLLDGHDVGHAPASRRPCAATAPRPGGDVPVSRLARSANMGRQRRADPARHARAAVFRRRGYVEADHPGYDPDKGARVQALMLSHSTAKGLRLDKFLRPAAVELAFRRRLGPEYAVIEQGLKGLGSAEEVMRVRALVQLMVKTSRCLGDGPRWDIDRVATILETWAAGNSDSPSS
ncbi:predicted protein [Verticillium alfalfae VaMs.102]|uniref:Predicted protein n=1 Tax=Verticillium alfalfae (strain VaMs.102 / ATCC MYA-4576 / FGSC 10136) TaxID=526221 RepID=C9SYG5_VERA1|nr:predicted protein [Verticillium alfalfae VaMs.102]EEY23830.1 predicted protein [Verticillium alfalfae VaMs.102]